MEERNNRGRVAVRTRTAVTDLDGYPKTELYFNAYEDGKCYNWSYDEEQEVLVEVLDIDTDNVLEVIDVSVTE